MTDEPILLDEIRRYSVKPGDVVIVRFAERLPESALYRLVEVLKDAFPDNQAIVLDAGATFEVATPEP